MVAIAIVEMIEAAGETIVATVVATDVTIVAAVTIAIDVGIAMIVAVIVTEEMTETDLDRVVIRFFYFNFADLKIRFWDL